MDDDRTENGQEAVTLEGVMTAIQDLAASTGEALKEQARQTELIVGTVGEIFALLAPKEGEGVNLEEVLGQILQQLQKVTKSSYEAVTITSRIEQALTGDAMGPGRFSPGGGPGGRGLDS